MSVILLFICVSSFGQKKDIMSVHVTVDDSIVNKYKDSLLFYKTNEVIVFQTDKPFDYLKSGDSLLTFITWRENGDYLTIVVSDKKIYPVISIAGQNIFDYPKKKMTYVTQDEKILKFTPPIIGNAVYFFTKTMSNYFELTGVNSQPWTYVPTNDEKENVRQEYFNLIHSTLNSEKFNLEINDNYKRQWK
jgi:hypothetical protein